MRVRNTVTGSLGGVASRTSRSRSNCDTPWVSTTTDIVGFGTQVSKEIRDIVTPGFFSQEKCGGVLPLNPLHVSTITYSRAQGSLDRRSKPTSSACWTSETSGAWASAIFIGGTGAPAWDEAIIASVGNRSIASVQQGIFDLSTNAAEIKDVYGLFRSNVVKMANLRKGVRDIAIRRFRQLSRAGKSVELAKVTADTWLEYRYGWLPLVYGVEDAVEAYSSTILKGDDVIGKASESEDLSDEFERTRVWDGYTINEVQVVSGSRVYRGYSHARVNMADKKRFQTNALVTAWELVPWSFVVDWFVDVGSYLQAVSAGKATVGLQTCVSVKDNITYVANGNGTHTATFPGLVTEGSITYGESRYVVDSYDRFPYNVTFPGLNPRLNSYRITDAVAFVVKALRSIK